MSTNADLLAALRDTILSLHRSQHVLERLLRALETGELEFPPEKTRDMVVAQFRAQIATNAPAIDSLEKMLPPKEMGRAG